MAAPQADDPIKSEGETGTLNTGPMTAEELRTHAAVTSSTVPGNHPKPVNANPIRDPHPLGRKVTNLIGEGPYRPTPSLDERNITSIDGYEEHKDLLGLAQNAFSSAFVGLEQLAKAREQCEKNPAWNDAQRLLNVGKLAEQVTERSAKAFDSAHKHLTNYVRELDRNLSAPLEGSAHSPLAKEIREYLRSLPMGKRGEFVSEAIDKGDKNVVSAMCGVPHYLAGLVEAQQEGYIRRWNEANNPVAVRRLEIARTALNLLETRHILVLKEAERAMKGTFVKMKAVREANSAAEQALIMQNGMI